LADDGVTDMPEGSAYSAAKVAAKLCTTALAATAPPLWLFSHLTPYHFLFSAPTNLSSFATLINVCAFTGYLLAAGVFPVWVLAGYAIRVGSRIENVLLTVPIVGIGVCHFYRGMYGFGPPDTSSRTVGTLVLLAVVIRWTPPLQRFLRAHPTPSVIVGYTFGIALVILIVLGFNAPTYVPVWLPDQLGQTAVHYIPIKGDDHSFYEAKKVSEFGFWDWLAAVGGMLVYLAAVSFWKSLLKPSTAPTQSIAAGVNKS
jgi:hypothetical protein